MADTVKKLSVVVVAAGKGERAGFAQNKVFAPLFGQPVLYYTLRNIFDGTPTGTELILVGAKGDMDLLAPYAKQFDCKLVEGGASRFESVYNGLKSATGELVLIHDGARPYVNKKILEDCVACVLEHGSGICALPATDTTVLCEDGVITAHPPRKQVYALQTPQGFVREEILKAYEQGKATPERFTDDSSVYGEFIRPAHVFLGDRENKKMTFPEDFKQNFVVPVVEGKLVGIGVDTHAFGKAQDYITLGGVKIPHACGLVAHSDGDVVYHAVADAMLASVGLRDIGYFFPDTSAETEGMDSAEILKRVLGYLNEMYYSVTGVTVAIQAERPKLGKFVDEMRNNLHELLRVPLNQVGVTVGTNEKLGYVGEGLGITVYACVTID